MRAPFYCPAAEGHLQRRDLLKLYDLMGPVDDHPQDPASALWHMHLTMRLLKAWDGGGGRNRREQAKQNLKRYNKILRQLKHGRNLSTERQDQLQRERATLEDMVLPPDACAACQKVEASTHRLSRYGRCKTQKYCGRECQTQHWGMHKRACRKVKQPAVPLQDTAEMRRLFPDQFEVPDAAELHEVEPGVVVKVCVPRHERFWVKVEAILEYDQETWNPTKFVGSVDNVLNDRNVHKLKFGDRIEVEPRHVYQVQWLWTSKLG